MKKFANHMHYQGGFFTVCLTLCQAPASVGKKKWRGVANPCVLCPDQWIPRSMANWR